MKTHSGVRAELHRTPKTIRTLTPSCAPSSARTYQLKAIADYETGPGAHITPEQAKDAITGARQFVEAIATLIGEQ